MLVKNAVAMGVVGNVEHVIPVPCAAAVSVPPGPIPVKVFRIRAVATERY